MKFDLIINSLAGGGTERVMSSLANAFVTKHNVRLITFNEGSSYTLTKTVTSVPLRQGSIKNYTLRSIKNLWHFYKQKANRPDVLIAFLTSINLIAITVSKLLGIKVIISEHTNHTTSVNRKTKWIQRFVYKYVLTTTVLTPFDKPYYLKHGAKVAIMPNPINLPESIKRFSKSRKNLLLEGSLSRYENTGFDSLLNLIAPILRNNPDWTLTIAGGGDKGLRILRNLTNQLKLKDQAVLQDSVTTYKI